MRRRDLCTGRTSSEYLAVRVALTLSAAAGCAATAPPFRPPPAAPRPAAPPPSDERRMYIDVQPEQLGFDHSLQVRRSNTGVPHELRSGGQVTADDHIQVHVRTSVDAYLYLAFCSRHGITMYPSQGSLRAQAGMLTIVPPASALVVDDEPGTEVLYVIASATDLSVADPRLAAALATKRPGTAPQDCGPTFEASLGSPGRPPPAAAPAALRGQLAPVPRVIRGQSVTKRSLPSSVPPHAPAPPRTAESAKSANAQASPPPDPDFVRNAGNAVWYLGGNTRDDDTRGPATTPRVGDSLQVTAADSTGIAVVRHVFIHVAR